MRRLPRRRRGTPPLRQMQQEEMESGDASQSIPPNLADWELVNYPAGPQTARPGGDPTFPTPGSRSGDGATGDDDLPDFDESSPAAAP